MMGTLHQTGERMLPAEVRSLAAHLMYLRHMFGYQLAENRLDESLDLVGICVAGR